MLIGQKLIYISLYRLAYNYNAYGTYRQLTHPAILKNKVNLGLPYIIFINCVR